jgi:two-component system, OmpR family, KDP operon response regulator KdpE
MAKVLVVDDDEILLKLINVSLNHHKFEVSLSRDGKDAIRTAYHEHPDAVIVDIMMREMHGVELCKRLREMTDAPIIVLSSMSDEELVIDALEAGADDYVTKPYSVAELVARIRAQLRNRTRSTNGTSKTETVLTAGEVSIDIARRRVTVRGDDVDLTPTEYTLLLCLVRNHDKVVDHRRLLSEGWGPEFVDQLEYLRLYIRYLRQKIEETPANPKIIKTERGIGYYIAH